MGGARVQQGSVVVDNENQGVNALPLWFVKGNSPMTPGQGEVITEYVIHEDGGGSFQP